MSDQLRAALNLAKGIQADIDAAGLSPAHAHEYTIDGVRFATSRPLPEAVRRYMAQWANDPCWDIDNIGAAHDPHIAHYLPELRAYAEVYTVAKDEEWEMRIVGVTDLRAAKIAYLRGDRDDAMVRVAIAQAEAAQEQAAQLKRIADSLSMDNDLTVIDAIYSLVEAIAHHP